jgi:hypothetical protein
MSRFWATEWVVFMIETETETENGRTSALSSEQ